jgi:hypothetical protein
MLAFKDHDWGRTQIVQCPLRCEVCIALRISANVDGTVRIFDDVGASAFQNTRRSSSGA